ncbi:uncharacterized protein DUF1735 [Arcticibacter tournemirensis]|nr:DUF5013 domain-containing protein [Arcticibacter tournemirensis]TQM51323.1 uncharacterized protein DUF1735 [Arcticibacter tournemirensis]
MKLKYPAAMLLLLYFATGFEACDKADSDQAFGITGVYMPQANIGSGGVDNNYLVPAGTDTSTYNYIVDRPGKKIHIIMGASLTGSESGPYSVDISVDNDTTTKMLSNGTYDRALYKQMPASMFTLPAKLEVAAGQRGATFRVSLNIDQLKLTEYAGKKLLLAVKIANPTHYTLISRLSTTIMILDVNALVVGPRKDWVGSSYLKNPGNPFAAAALQPGQTRWGTLADWKTNASVLSHGGYGGFSSGLLNMESGWGSPQILNGKIYQTVTLPAGNYYYDLSGGDWSGGEHFLKDPAYSVVAMNVDSLPDYKDIAGNPNIKYVLLTKAPQQILNFQLTETTKITLGSVINYIQNEQGFKTKQVLLYSYPQSL